MRSTHSLLLASTALLVAATALPPAQAAAMEQPLVVAQAPSGNQSPQQQPQQPQKKPAQQQPAKPQVQAPAKPPAAGQPRPSAQTPAPRTTPPAPQQPAAKPPGKPLAPTAQQPNSKPQPSTVQQQQPTGRPTPPPPGGKPQPLIGQQPSAKPPAPTAQQPNGRPQQPNGRPQPSTVQQQPIGRPTPPPPADKAATVPQRPRDASEFIRRNDQQPGRGLDDLRRERREMREGNRVIIREGSRTIVRENNRVIIRHNEADRFAIGALNVRVDRRGAMTETIIERPNGVRIINIVDADGRLIRRVRRDRDGREFVLINNVYRGPRVNVFVALPPPVIRIPRERYIVEVDHAPPAMIYDVFVAPPVERLERHYTLDEVRYSAPLRERMPRVDLDINFDTGSWQITPAQMAKLSVVAEGLNRAIRRNAREVFLIEGYTDAVGSTDDNLSLSDRRAEAVAVALTEQFNVPAENLVTQGYGEQNLKVPTQGAEPRNRRVSVRRITPLIEQTAQR